MTVRNWLWQKRFWHVLCGLLLVSGGLLLWCAPGVQAQLDTVTVAVTILPPFIWEDETGALAGFDIELLEALAAQADLRLTYTKAEFRYLLPGIVTRLYDVGAGCIALTPERQAQLAFTRPYFASGLALVVNTADTGIHSLADLTGESTVGVLDGSTGQTFAQAHTIAAIHPVLTSDTAFTKVEAGELNGAIASEIEFLAYRQQHPDTTLETVGGLLTYGECALAINQADTVLSDKLDAALTELKADGTYDELYQKWFGKRPLPEKPLEPTVSADIPTPVPSPSPTPAGESTPALTTTMTLAGIYYITLSKKDNVQPAARYQLLTLAANGLWFVNESPAPSADNSNLNAPQGGQSGLWFVNSNGAVEATLLTFATPAPTDTAAVIRKDYQMQVDHDGHVVGSYYVTYYAADLFASVPPPTATMTQTVEFTGRRVE